MQYRRLGNTGLIVSRFCLGAMTFGGAATPPYDKVGGLAQAEATQLVDMALDAGINFIDTADVYSAGESEILLGQALQGRRDAVVVATKFHAPMGSGPNDAGQSRLHLTRALDASLRRLGTDYIDLYQIHNFDPLTPLEETLRALDDAVSAGKILYAGLSNFPAWRVARADAIAGLRGWAPLIGLQMEYSLAERSAEREALPMLDALGLGGALWSPLGGGLLTGKYRNNEEGRLQGLNGFLTRTEKSARERNTVDAVLAVAAELDAPATQVAIAWLLQRGAAAQTTLVPILGPRSRAQLDGTLGALTLKLTPEQYARLDAASAIALGAPYEVNAQTAPRIAGGAPELLQPARLPVA